MKTLRKGFTLVELIIVLVIIGILSGIAYIAYKSIVTKTGIDSIRTTAQSVDHEAVAVGAASQPQEGADGATVVKSLDAQYGAGVLASGVTTWGTANGTAIVVTKDAAQNGYTFKHGTGYTGPDSTSKVCYTPSGVVAVNTPATGFVDGACTA